MLVLRIVLVVHLVALSVYTAIVIGNHGLDLLPVFFGDIAAMGWPGQFNFDFLGFLVLAALWTAWRNNFSALGLLLAAVSFFGGMAFLSTYLLILSLSARDIPDLLLGRAAR
ncbi:MAG: hypothetical protein KBA31_08840 [Alphaproteobacteria bacterium]|nr:hypothetical protein [Alphaproteobacteria bacterium]